MTGKPEAATAVVGMLLDHCREALADAGDADTVAGLLAALLARGNGASFQRAAYRRSGRLAGRDQQRRGGHRIGRLAVFLPERPAFLLAGGLLAR